MEKVRLAVGSIVKPHGIKGELNVMMTERAEPEEDFAAGSCLFIEIEGLDVPFFVSSVRSRGGDSLLLTFDEVSDEKAAAELAGKTLYTYVDAAELADDDEITAGALVGYEIADAETARSLGRIADLTELTPGCWYFVLEEEGKLIPAVDEMILSVNPEARRVVMSLPEGLLEL